MKGHRSMLNNALNEPPNKRLCKPRVRFCEQVEVQAFQHNLASFLRQYTNDQSTIYIHVHRLGSEKQTLRLQSSEVSVAKLNDILLASYSIFPNAGKLELRKMLAGHKNIYVQTCNYLTACRAEKTRINTQLDCGDDFEANNSLVADYDAVVQRESKLIQQQNRIMKEIKNTRFKLFDASTCLSNTFLHIVIISPLLMCVDPKFKNAQDLMEKTKTMMMETFMCYQHDSREKN
jgi:hypothetical protein